ncbi:MAG: MFS transporter [Dehalococcoidales bacterium]|nr:MFS transporter [Dehalococcoidales bacterium]
MDSHQKRSKVFYGWYIVGACLALTLYTGGVVYFGFTAIFEPIASEFGWSYAQISLAASLRGLETGLLAPIMGLLADRWGPRKLILGGTIIISLGFLLLSQVSSLAVFYMAFALLAIGMSTCTGTVLMTAVTNWFRRRAGLVIGIVASGFGLGGLLVPVVTGLIDTLQWRLTMIVIGIGMLVIGPPLALLVRHKPENYGYQPDGDISSPPETEEVPVSPAIEEVNIPARQAFRTRAFWYLSVSAMFHSLVVGAVITHMMPYLSSVNFSRGVSSLLTLLLPLASIAGRLGSGWLADRIGSRRLLTTGFILMTAGMFLFGYVTTGMAWLLIPFIITFSLGWGSNVTTRISLLREYFGRTSFGTILGFMSGIIMLGNMAGAPIAGLVYDTWGSYQGAWLSFGMLTLLGAAIVLILPNPGQTGKQAA